MISIKDITDGFSTVTRVITERLNKRLSPASQNQNYKTSGLGLPQSFYSPFVIENGKLLKIFTYGISEYSQESDEIIVPSNLPRMPIKSYLLINSEDI